MLLQVYKLFISVIAELYFTECRAMICLCMHQLMGIWVISSSWAS